MPEISEEQWDPARLIPVSGLRKSEEQERCAASALLAVVSAVREFGREILRPLGAPAGAVSTYTEVPFELGGKRYRVDGLVRVTRGRKVWTLLIEVKTGRDQHNREQVEAYLDIARQQDFKGGLLTISNEIAPWGHHPVSVDKRKYGKTSLNHLSWFRILSRAVSVKEHSGVSDPDQAWILGELIRYLEHENSGATAFNDMGAAWPSVRDSVRAGTLRAVDDGASEVAQRWDQLLQYAALKLGSSLGEDVNPLQSRRTRKVPDDRTRALVAGLAEDGRLTGALAVSSVPSPIEIEADLRMLRAEASIQVSAPELARSSARVNWLLRQLGDAPSDARVDALFPRSRVTTSELLGTLRGNAKLLIDPMDRPPRAFVVAWGRQVGGNRGMGRNSFIEEVVELVSDFQERIAQHIKEAPRQGREQSPPEERAPSAHESPVVSRVGAAHGVQTTAIPQTEGRMSFGSGIEREPEPPEQVVSPASGDVLSGPGVGSETEPRNRGRED